MNATPEPRKLLGFVDLNFRGLTVRWSGEIDEATVFEFVKRLAESKQPEVKKALSPASTNPGRRKP